jgi:hypothetical protein
VKRIKDLLAEWESAPRTHLTSREYAIRLPIHDAARLAAPAEMYPGIGVCGIITDLISASLDELESAIPYVQDDRVIAEDEFGDPVHEDTGSSPRFHQLSRARTKDLQEERIRSRELKNGRK